MRYLSSLKVLPDKMILIGVPVDKDYRIDVRTAAYCASEAKAVDVAWGYVSSRDAGVGRSTIIHTILQNPDITHFYSIDSDVVPPDYTLNKLLSYDLPIVAGIYPMKGNLWSFKLNNQSNWQPRTEPLPDKLFEATCIGGSTILIERGVLVRLGEPCFNVSYRKIDDRGMCYDEGEDEYFSRVAREAGYKIMVDPQVICKHYNYGEI